MPNLRASKGRNGKWYVKCRECGYRRPEGFKTAAEISSWEKDHVNDLRHISRMRARQATDSLVALLDRDA